MINSISREILHRLRLIASSTLLIALLLQQAVAQGFDDVEIRSTPVADGIWMLTGRGGNMGLAAGPDGAFLVDDQYAPLSDRILAAIADITDSPLRFVINTHWHGDHTGGNQAMGKAGALIFAHENVRERLSTEQFLEFFNTTVPAAPGDALPVVTFTESVTFHINNQTVHVFHAPHAHTDGDGIVHFREANVIHTGDIVFWEQYPFIDLDSGGSVAGMIRAVDRILELADADTRIIPGHGPLIGRAEMARYRELLTTVRDRVKTAVEAGLTLEDIKSAGLTAEFDAVWGGGFIPPERWIELLHRDLSR